MAEPPADLRTITIDLSRALPTGSRVTLEPWLPGVEFEPRRAHFIRPV